MSNRCDTTDTPLLDETVLPRGSGCNTPTARVDSCVSSNDNRPAVRVGDPSGLLADGKPGAAARAATAGKSGRPDQPRKAPWLLVQPRPAGCRLAKRHHGAPPPYSVDDRQ